MSAPLLFAPQTEPRVFGVPVGLDFPAETVRGLQERLSGQPPEALARVELLVNTSRMKRRLRDILTAPGRVGFLPRIRLVTDLGTAADMADLPRASSSLRRQLELTELVSGLLDRAPDLGPRSAVLDLTASLVRLLDECEAEGVALSTLSALDVGNLSSHWDRALRFISIVAPFLDASGAPPGPQGRQRMAVLRQIARWQESPPDHPVMVVGSTGSRGSTALLMEAVSRLPQGAVLLPGFDFEQPGTVWGQMREALTNEDHPQFRLGRLLDGLGLDPTSLPRWTGAQPAVPSRNRLISLALRPAPVTDQWRDEGPGLTDIPAAMSDVTLVEARSHREEALSIAIALREAAASGKHAALVTPDRVLSRQVTAALDRWRIDPDDSAGRPLILSAPGRFLRHVAEIIGTVPSTAQLLILLKHPLTHSEHPARGDHLRHTRDLELYLRAHPWTPTTPDMLMSWASAATSPHTPSDPNRPAWMAWVIETLFPLEPLQNAPLATFEATHRATAERLAAGPATAGAGGLWDKEAGSEALSILDKLRDEADAGGTFTPRDYAILLAAQLATGEVRDPTRPDPRVMIWGTLEARVQGADLVILAGLNEGSWPGLPDPDPWMNRQMRHDAGLLVPERQIGLSAHDFQQAIGTSEVILSRATRDSDAETVPSRWLNRLVNLLEGVGPQGGDAVAGMRARGADLMDLARRLDRPSAQVSSATRPSPKVKRAQIKPRISASRVETLIRDPFVIYASDVLRLQPLPPLDPAPNAALRGTVLHRVLEQALSATRDHGAEMTEALLRKTAAQVLAAAVPWPEIRTLWLARFADYAGALAAEESARLARATPIALERKGNIPLPSGVTLSCEADRIDQTEDGRIILYDYKTGAIPSDRQIESFAKQLHLEAIIAGGGGFADLPPMDVSELTYLRINKGLGQRTVLLDSGDVDRARDEFIAVIDGFLAGQRGYTARRMTERVLYVSEYDHLSRFGEWDLTDTAVPEDMP